MIGLAVLEIEYEIHYRDKLYLCFVIGSTVILFFQISIILPWKLCVHYGQCILLTKQVPWVSSGAAHNMPLPIVSSITVEHLALDNTFTCNFCKVGLGSPMGYDVTPQPTTVPRFPMNDSPEMANGTEKMFIILFNTKYSNFKLYSHKIDMLFTNYHQNNADSK